MQGADTYAKQLEDELEETMHSSGCESRRLQAPPWPIFEFPFSLEYRVQQEGLQESSKVCFLLFVAIFLVFWLVLCWFPMARWYYISFFIFSRLIFLKGPFIAL